MTIAGVTNNKSLQAAGGPKAPDALERNDFLNLLVAQLQHQDPLKPMDSTDFTAQLAQFSSLEQLSNMNDQLKALTTSQTALNNTQAVSYIGKTLLCNGNATQIVEGEPEPLQVALDGSAASVFVSVYDGTGDLRSTFNAGAMPAGRGSIDWPGTDMENNTLADGHYWFEIAAVDGAGKDVESATMSSGRVSGVAFDGGEATLIVNGLSVRMEDIIEVAQTEADDAS